MKVWKGTVAKTPLVMLGSLLLVFLLSLPPPAYAAQVSLEYLSGSATSKCSESVTGTSPCKGEGYQYIIDISATSPPQCSTTAASSGGVCAGDNSSYVGLQINMEEFANSGGVGFTVSSMTKGDQYEIDFTVGTLNFAMEFWASGASAGNLTLWYFSSGFSSWDAGASVSCPGGGCVSGKTYGGGGNDAFSLTNITKSTDGAIAFYVSKNYLGTLGASGGTVSNIVASTYSSSPGCPDGSSPSGGFCPTPTSFPTVGSSAQDYCPNSGTLSYTLTGGAVPELPYGVVPLAGAVLAVYYALRRRKTGPKNSSIGTANGSARDARPGSEEDGTRRRTG